MSNFKLKKGKFGLLSDGTEVNLYTISNGQMSFSVTDYGCTITSIILPGKNGEKVDIALGYSTLEGYIWSNLFYGAAVGRFANRIGNASFKLNGTEYKLDNNDGGNCLHGGFDCWNKIVWDTEYATKDSVCFSHVSPDGEQGFPGKIKVFITYELKKDNKIRIIYYVESLDKEKSTPINLTNHTYFNLKGHNKGSIEDNILQIKASKYLEINEKLLPTGNMVDVKGTAFDFTEPKAIGKDIKAVGLGYDHCFCCDMKGEDEVAEIAVLEDPESGRKMRVNTTMPGVQLYTANFIEGSIGKSGILYHNHNAVCLETEYYPDSPNVDKFPSCILEPLGTHISVTEYAFEF